jgi:serine/threonine-protein kinase RsbW
VGTPESERNRPPSISLRLPAEPESVPQARHAIAEFGAASGLGEKQLYDLRTVVTEACANIVEHAYGDEPGIIELHAAREDGGVTVTIRDHGDGMQPRAGKKPWSLRLGLVLIGTLSSSFQCSSAPGEGTELRMHVAA